jgi:hypothetical protein
MQEAVLPPAPGLPRLRLGQLMDFLLVPTINFRLLSVLVILRISADA